MARVQTTRNRFQKLASVRIAEARALYREGKYSGAYYLAGLSVECAVKAIICRQFKRHAWPDKNFVLDVHCHDINKLLQKAQVPVGPARDRDPSLRVNLGVVLDWSVECRYQTLSRAQARDLIDAVDGAHSPVLAWLVAQW